MHRIAEKLLAFILIVQFSSTQQAEQSPLLRCLTGYRDRHGKLSDCPPNKVFSKCVTTCPKTCQNPYIKSNNENCLRDCRSGCVCANGTIIDEGRSGDCVPQDECTCHHHGRVFMPNEVLLRNGKKCQCKNGGWDCVEQSMTSRTCSVVGLTHVETFDGALLTIKPGNYILVQNIDKKSKHFQIEAAVKKNFKRQLKFTIGVNTVVLSDIHSIILNKNKLEQLPFQSADLTIRQATSHFILIESKDMHIAYDGHSVYVTLESAYREHVHGLCGSFDYNQDNDLRLPNGKLTCNAHIFSEGYQVNDTKPNTSTEDDVPENFDRSEAEKQCHRIKNNVCKSGAHVHGLILSCVEDQRHTPISKHNRASCYWHSIFAHACALTGNDHPQKNTKWRSECEAVFTQCGAGTVYEECPHSCLNSCSDKADKHGSHSTCKKECIAGCVCEKHHYYDTHHSTHEPLKCVKGAECSCFDEREKSYHKSGTIIKRGHCSTCICIRGQFHCNSDKCDKSNIVCPNNLIFTETSLTACPKTCSNHLEWQNCHKYRSGCDCPKDMIRDENTNRCVYPKHCSCKMNDKLFSYGAKVTQDCNECTCTSGQWSCSKLDCSHTCSILKNKHYTTFHGQHLKLNSGSCEYIAAQLKNHKDKFTLILSNSESKNEHSLQGRMTIDGINISFESDKSIYVNDKALTTSTSTPAHYSSFTIHKAGLFVVINGTHFILRWDMGNRIYLTVDKKWKGKLDGVCSEHGSSNKDYVIQKPKYADSWKIDSECKVEESKPTDDEEKSKWAHEKCVAVFDDSSSAKNPFSSCLSKLNNERRKTLYQQCIEETHSCKIDAHNCAHICSWFASLSELCRKEGHPITSWRNDDFCSLTCDENEEYKSCGTICRKTCNDLDSTSMKKCYNDSCNEGCYCKEGYVLDNNGDCVKPEECSKKTTGRPSSATHQYTESIPTGESTATKKPSNSSGTEQTTSMSGSSTISPVHSSTIGVETTTTVKICEEIEFISDLIAINAITTTPADLSNKEDLIRKGVNFTEKHPIFVINIPKGGARIRDLKVFSSNVKLIEIIFTTESGHRLSPITTGPTTAPKKEFPTENVEEIIINILETTDDSSPQKVTLSIITCGGHGATTTGGERTTGHAGITGHEGTTHGGHDTTRGHEGTAGQGTTHGHEGTTGGEGTTHGHEGTTGGEGTTRGHEATAGEGTTHGHEGTTGGEGTTRGHETTGDEGTTRGHEGTTGGDGTTRGHVGTTRGTSGTSESEETTRGTHGTTGGEGTTRGHEGTTSGEGTTRGHKGTTAGEGTTRGHETTGGEGTTHGGHETTGDAGTTRGHEGTTGGEGTTHGHEGTTGGEGTTHGHEGTTGGDGTTHGGHETTGDAGTTRGHVGTTRGTSGTSESEETTRGTHGTTGGEGTTHGHGGTTGGEGTTRGGHDTTGDAGTTHGHEGTTGGEGTTHGHEGTTGGEGTTRGGHDTTGGEGTTHGHEGTTGGEGTTHGHEGTTGGEGTTRGHEGTTRGTSGTSESEETTRGTHGTTGAEGTTHGHQGTTGGEGTTRGHEGTTVGARTTGDSSECSESEETTPGTRGTTGGKGTTQGARGSQGTTSSGSGTTHGGHETTGGERTTHGHEGTTSGDGTTHGHEGTTGGEGTTRGGHDTTGGEGTTHGARGSQGTTASGSATTSKGKTCDEMEYIVTLLESNAVQTKPQQVSNIKDLDKKGVDFTDEKPTIVMKVPQNGAIVRNIELSSTNVKEIEVVFKTISGSETTPIRGSPSNLPSNKFPTDHVVEITITITETSDEKAPKSVRLSIIACAPGVTPSTGITTSRSTTGGIGSGTTRGHEGTTGGEATTHGHEGTTGGEGTTRGGHGTTGGKGTTHGHEGTTGGEGTTRGHETTGGEGTTHGHEGTTGGEGTTPGGHGTTGGEGTTRGHETTGGEGTTHGHEGTTGGEGTTHGHEGTTGGEGTTHGHEGTTGGEGTTHGHEGTTGGEGTTHGHEGTTGGEGTTHGHEGTTGGEGTTHGHEGTTGGEGTTHGHEGTTGGEGTTHGHEGTTGGEGTTSGGHGTTGGEGTTRGHETTGGEGTTHGHEGTTGGEGTTHGHEGTTGGEGTTRGHEGTTGGEGTTRGGHGTTGGEGTTHGHEGTTGGEGTTRGHEGTTGDEGTTHGARGSQGTTASGSATTSTGKTCDEMEYIVTLLESNAVQTKPKQVSNIKDLDKKGVDFTDEKPTIVMKVPQNGAIVRNIELSSTNVKEIEVVFKTISGSETTPIRGSPSNFPSNKFPTDHVVEITITITETSDEKAPKSVRLSIIACAPGVTPSTGKPHSIRCFCYYVVNKNGS
ncbi:unnamed protein product [Adineta steineri]|uniref:Uncharacterized protein n=1 Tax=Adineta steineri TaxID=433720 RepID=A0A814MG33_9BILA|nr:unnamed protein product [Adineta steineri]